MRRQYMMEVFRASAGSGKTFTLAARYMELLIKNPTAYRETLAVTFTNKATEEMKTRILSQLYGLSHGLRDSEAYLKEICSGIGCTEQEVRRKAATALSLMLHDYTNFHVETIDSFFQRVLRNLAHELELNANLRVELNDGEVEEMAVDKLVAELRAGDKPLRWIISYIENQIKEDKNAFVINGIKSFGTKIFRQEYRDNAKELEKALDEKSFETFQKKLRTIISDADNEMKKCGEAFFTMLEQAGYSVGEFKNGTRGAASYFNKLSGDYHSKDIFNASAQKAAEGRGGWVNKGKLDTPLGDFAETSLVPYINRAEHRRKEMALNRNTASVILRHLDELRLLHLIEREVRGMNMEANRMLLSDTQHILRELMRDSDAPFVFERIGGRLLNMMIDEFQDTSTTQWANFKKLLLDCMAREGSRNLVVGDVKQSIYRWRDGDWSLLNNIGADRDLSGKDVHISQLSMNYRSEKRIVRFNNEFFLAAAPVERAVLEADGNGGAGQIEQIYSRELVEQRWPEGKAENGLVEITLLKGEDFDAECFNLTKSYVRQLLDAGAQDKDIAIIVRKNKNIERLANRLQEEMPDHRFISDEAFKLEASLSVNVIIDAMRLLLHGEDSLLRAQLANEYQTHVCGRGGDEVQLYSREEMDRLLPFDYVHATQRLLSLPLNDLAEQLFALFGLNRLPSEAAYVNAFFDQMDAFTKDNVPDLGAFLDRWDEALHKKAVSGGDLQGIRLMTIHKSKGLEFDHVIVPYCDWKLEPEAAILWCTTDVSPFSDIPIIPVESNSSLKNTVYAKDYHEEKLQNCIDNLNMLYVAFTRAAKNLFVIGKNSMNKNGNLNTSSRSGLLQRVLPELPGKLEGSTLEGDSADKEAEIHFRYGSMYIRNKVERQSENVFLQRGEAIEIGTNQPYHGLEFRQSNRSRNFVSGDRDEPANRKYITQGTVMHNVLSMIRDSGEVERVLADFLQEGVISDSDAQLNRKTLAKLIRTRIENNRHAAVNRWFSPEVKVFNECGILSIDPQTGLARELRPDRVVCDGGRMTVIDFKFGTPRDEHQAQVRSYMQLLRDMGHAEVDGYLWYVYGNEIVKVSE